MIEARIQNGRLIISLPIEIVREGNGRTHNELPPGVLTPREASIFQLMRRGLVDKEICAALNVTKSTVTQHKHNIFVKLGCESRAELLLKFGYTNEEP